MTAFFIVFASVIAIILITLLCIAIVVEKRKKNNNDNNDDNIEENEVDNNEIKESKPEERTQVIKQNSALKIIIKLLGVLMLIFGYPITYDIPDNIYGLTWTELGAMAEGNSIDNTQAMFDFLGISKLSDLTTDKINDMEVKAQNAFDNSLFLACLYWATCSALLFIHIKTKKIIVKGVITNENN